MHLLRRTLFVAFTLCMSASSLAAKVENYLPSNATYSQSIPRPESILGFGIGERHVRHDQLVNYFKAIADSSNKVQLETIGKTNESRDQILVTISAPKNLADLDAILEKRSFTQKNTGDGPIVLWLGYSVHGDEISGAHAAMVVAYHLAASEDESVAQMLENTIIVMEPSINPDGMDRFTNWVNTYRGTTPNGDPNHIEHHQQWRTGRTNHFGFDLNRDWLLLSQKETKHRMPYYYKYQPNVLGDYHEMQSHATFFFQPGIPTRTHPFTPKENQQLTQVLATFHADAFDQENRLYYTQEQFDDFYYGKGSTYPDINGGVGILFEQASSRGMQQNTPNGLLTFEYGIKNQVLASLSTIKGTWENKEKLQKYRENFYKNAKKAAKSENFDGYIISEDKDNFRIEAFLEKLAMHQVNVYPLTKDFEVKGKRFAKSSSYYIPLEQPQYRVIKALFSKGTNFQDNTFYDVSGWTMPYAMDIDFVEVDKTRGLKLAEQPWRESQPKALEFVKDAYAYAFDWHHFKSPKLLNALLSNNIKARVATKPFSVPAGNSTRQFERGSILLPTGIQTNPQWQSVLAQASAESNIEIVPIKTGLIVDGIDLGSRSFEPLASVNVLLVGGKGASQYEAAEVLFYLDDQLGIPVSVVEKERLGKIDLSYYSHIIFVSGSYNDIANATHTKIEAWVKSGGVVIAQKGGAKWLADKGTLNATFYSKNKVDRLFDTSNLSYQDKEKIAGRKRIAGAIYATKLDVSHPLAYGFNDDSLPMFKNSTLIMEKPSAPYVTVAQFTDSPLMSGYTDEALVRSISNTAAVVGHNLGKGRVIATTNNFAFRAYWYGSARFLTNSLFFAKAFSAPSGK